MSTSDAAPSVAVALPATLATLDLLKIELRGAVLHVRLDRPAKRNAVSDALVAQLHTCFVNLPDAARAVVLSGEGDHFCAGLDLAEVSERSVAEGIVHSRSWHAAFERVQFGKVPVVAVLHGAVIGGGLELAAATHIRVAESSAFYALPEGSRGIYVGGGASVRLPALIGTSRVMEMMLTGRTLNAEEGHAIGLSHHLVGNGKGFATALELAERIAGNAPFTNFAATHLLPRIARSDPAAGYATEALAAAIAQGEPEAKARLKAFLEKRGPKVARR